MTKSSHAVLIVDDDSDGVLSLTKVLRQRLPEISLSGAGSAASAITLAQETQPHVAIIDLHLDSNRGVEAGFALLSELQQRDQSVRVIVLTGHGSIEYGVRALTLGAASFLEKPADIDHLCALVRDGIRQSTLRRAYQSLAAQRGGSYQFVGSSPAAEKVRSAIDFAARTSQPVFLFGETGTGKGLVARCIHEGSGRTGFVRYQPNFATPDLVNSELFGHVKGAFTGAQEGRDGLLLQAQQGTFFLDEIDELPLETQVTLLGVIQERTYRPVGSNKEAQVNFRLICATNREPESAITAGKLRKDLYHRIAHTLITLPPLRTRKEDIPELVHYVLERFNQQSELSIVGVSEPGLALLASYDWPGNVRELQAVLEGAAWRAQIAGTVMIEPAHLELPSGASAVSSASGGLREQVEQFKQKLIQDTLQRHGGNLVRTAQELGLDRTSLRRMMRRSAED